MRRLLRMRVLRRVWRILGKGGVMYKAIEVLD